MRPPVLPAYALSVLLFCPLAAAGTTILVDVDGGGDHTSILLGVMAASDGDTVLIAPGVYEGAFNANISLGDKNLVIRGISDPESTELYLYPNGRAFSVAGGQDSTCVIENLRFHRGTSAMGGGVYVHDSSPKIVNCRFYRCSATAGGGAVWNDGGNVTFVDCGFNRNWTNREEPGGAVWCTDASATFRDGWFVQNGRVRGEVDGQPYSDGAAVMIEGASTAVFRHVLFDDNGGHFGGAVSSTSASAVFDECTFVDNVGKYYGGVLSAEAGGIHEFTGCLFAHNTSTGDGGGIGCSAGTVMLDGCTLVDNKSTSAGSAVALADGAHLEATRTIIAFSVYSAPLDCSGSTASVAHSCVFGNAVTDSLCGDHHDNLFVNAQFCDRPAGDYTIYSHSVCLPANNPWGEQIGVFGQGCLYTGPLEPPAGLAAWTDGNTVFLSWRPARDVSFDHYRVERDTTAAFGEHTTTMTTADTVYVDAPLPNGVEQFYRIFTIDTLGGASAPSETLSIVVHPIAPSTPTDFAVVAGDAVVGLSWTASPEGDVDHYAVYRDTTAGAPPVDPYDVVAGTALSDEGVANYVSYYYKVTAVDTGGLESGPTDELRAVAHGTPPAVTGLRAVPGDSSAFLDWDAVVPRYQDFYRIYRDTIPSMLSKELLADGFEDYGPGEPPADPPWGVIEQDGTSVRVTDSLAGEGVRSLALADSSFSHLRIFHALGDTSETTAWIRFLVRPGSVMPEVNILQCEISGEQGIGYQAGLLEIRDAVLTHWLEGSGTVAIAPIDPGEWHDIEWRLDCVADTYGVWLDGDHVVEGAPFYNDARYLDVLQFRTRNTEWSRSWVDGVLRLGHVDHFATAQENAYVDRPLESGRTYYYRVSVVDTFGAHGPLSEVVAVTPGWVGIDEEIWEPPLSPVASQSAPNPFGSATALSYTVPAPGARVTVRVYDAGGRLVRTLVDGRAEGGVYHLTWSGRDRDGQAVASGVYFCRVSIGEWSETRKMVLVR